MGPESLDFSAAFNAQVFVPSEQLEISTLPGTRMSHKPPNYGGQEYVIPSNISLRNEHIDYFCLTGCSELNRVCKGPMCFECERIRLKNLQNALENFFCDPFFDTNKEIREHLDYDKFMPIDSVISFFNNGSLDVTNEDVIMIAERSRLIELDETSTKVRKIQKPTATSVLIESAPSLRLV